MVKERKVYVGKDVEKKEIEPEIKATIEANNPPKCLIGIGQHGGVYVFYEQSVLNSIASIPGSIAK